MRTRMFRLRLTSVCRAARRLACSLAEDDMPKGKFFYAVRQGFKPGVYQTWAECQRQVDKFPSAVFKKFISERDAWAFVRGVQLPPLQPQTKVGPTEEPGVALLPKRGPEPLQYIPLGQKRPLSSDDADKLHKRAKTSHVEPGDGFTYMGDAVVVYTDGCCSANGRKNARAGIGVYWGHNHPLNVAERLAGRQTNQRAEIRAACRALEQAAENGLKKVVLYTDSMFTINGVTKWVKKWKENKWKLQTGGDVKNRKDFERLDFLNSQLQVHWLHIPGHAGYTGNEQADRLSREGAAKPQTEEHEEEEEDEP